MTNNIPFPTLSASIMCADWLNLERELHELESLGIDRLHVDVIDGVFAPDFTMGSSIVNLIRRQSRLPIEFHMMVEAPTRFLKAFDFSAGDIFTMHQESSRSLHRDLLAIRREGFRVGIALNPATPASALDYVIEEVDLVQIMTVNPGFMGQSLVPQVLRKIKEVKVALTRGKYDVELSVDGSVGAPYVAEMVRQGADSLVLGTSGLFRQDKSKLEALKELKGEIVDGLRGSRNVL